MDAGGRATQEQLPRMRGATVTLHSGYEFHLFRLWMDTNHALSLARPQAQADLNIVVWQADTNVLY